MGKWTIKKQLIFAMISLSLLAIVSITMIGTIKSTSALIKSNLNALDAIRVSKTDHIEDYFGTMKQLLITTAYSQQTKDAMSNFDVTFGNLSLDTKIKDLDTISLLSSHYNSEYLNKINFDIPNVPQKQDTLSYIPHSKNAQLAQYLYIVDNQNKIGEKNNLSIKTNYQNSYIYTHNRHHDTFNTILKNYSLYDMFLVNTSGDIVYTVFKEKDYATNLNNDAYKNSTLAKVYKKALSLKEGEVAFEDFAPYEPSYNLPASFVATPIKEDDQTIGVLIFQLPIDQIDHIMSFGGKYKEVGLGDSGECYLVGADYKMKNNSRFTKDIDDKIVQKLGTTIGILEVKSKSSTNAMSGKSNAEIIKDYRGISVLSSYGSFNVFGQKWGIIAEIDESEILAPVNELIAYTIGLASIILMCVILIALMVANKIATPIKNTIEALKNISLSVLNSATMITDSSISMSESANHQAATVEEITATVEQATANTQLNSDHSSQANILSKEVSVYANNGYAQIKTLQKSMQSITSSSDEIYKITKTIDEIAFQTNLLSLNAAVEAARAGEHGLSFAVVADEVRSLANKSATAAKETAHIIEKSLQEVEVGNKINDGVNTAFGDIVSKVAQSNSLISEISISSKELSIGMRQVSGVLIDIDKVTQTMAAAAEELASSAEELRDQASDMDTAVRNISQLV